MKKNYFTKKISKSNLGLAKMKDKYITVPKKKVDPIDFFGKPPQEIRFIDKHLDSYFLFPFKEENNGEYRLSKLSAFFSIKKVKVGDEIYIERLKEKGKDTFVYYIDLISHVKENNNKDYSLYPDEEVIQNDENLIEGGRITITVNKYERSRTARDKCVKHWKAICSVCHLEFKQKYGAAGKGFIHVHHLIPVSNIGKSYKIDPIKDLIPVCPNCHSMIHRKKAPYTIEEVQKMLTS